MPDGLSNLGSLSSLSIKYFGRPDSKNDCTGRGIFYPVAFIFFSSINKKFSPGVLAVTFGCSFKKLYKKLNLLDKSFL
jgi:hypothetical protein